jgi:hypothetical protein
MQAHSQNKGELTARRLVITLVPRSVAYVPSLMVQLMGVSHREQSPLSVEWRGPVSSLKGFVVLNVHSPGTA